MMIKATTTRLLQSVWTLASWVGMRRLGDNLKRWYPSAYGDTIFYFDNNNEVNGFVALTIDDGLCRNHHQEASMVKELRKLLEFYNAHATFFVCKDYTTIEEASLLLQDGHELGNHLEKDLSGYYCKLDKEQFRDNLLRCNRFLEKAMEASSSSEHSSKIKWFRAPQGRMTPCMNQVLKEEGLISILGDCYCDDWCFAEKNCNTHVVAPLMVRQVQPGGGSIAIFHMPEHGFREASFKALKEFLGTLKTANMTCITLSEMMSKSKRCPTISC